MDIYVEQGGEGPNLPLSLSHSRAVHRGVMRALACSKQARSCASR